MIQSFRKRNITCQESHKKVDVYAFAISALEVLLRRRAWENNGSKEIEIAVQQGLRPNLPDKIENQDKISATLVNIIKSGWSEDPANRPTMQQILDKLA